MGISLFIFSNSATAKSFFAKSIIPTVFFAFMLWTSLPPPAFAAAKVDASQGTIVVLGDSISAAYGIQREQGWVHLLDQYLAEHHAGWQIINASISGETTGGALARLAGVLEATHPKIVIVELGGNDGLRGYPIRKMKSNLMRIIETAQAQGAATVLAEMQIPPNYGRRYTQEFAQSFNEVATQSDTLLIPFLLEQVALQPEFMQDDGIHPTALAQPLIVDAVLPYLLTLIE